MVIENGAEMAVGISLRHGRTIPGKAGAASFDAMTETVITWRGAFEDAELNALHAEAFEHELYADPWNALVHRHSLGWVVAGDESGLAGFVNVPWDGAFHAWIQDVMVAKRRRRSGVGRELVASAVVNARAAGCEWLHVDFDAELGDFYFNACGFMSTAAGLIRL